MYEVWLTTSKFRRVRQSRLKFRTREPRLLDLFLFSNSIRMAGLLRRRLRGFQFQRACRWDIHHRPQVFIIDFIMGLRRRRSIGLVGMKWDLSLFQNGGLIRQPASLVGSVLATHESFKQTIKSFIGQVIPRRSLTPYFISAVSTK